MTIHHAVVIPQEVEPKSIFTEPSFLSWEGPRILYLGFDRIYCVHIHVVTKVLSVFVLELLAMQCSIQFSTPDLLQMPNDARCIHPD